MFGMQNFQMWKLHTAEDYFFFFLIIAGGTLFFWLIIRHMNQNRNHENAVKRTAAKLKTLCGGGAVLTDREVKTAGGSVHCDIIAAAKDRIWIVKVYHFGLHATGGANVRQWKLWDNSKTVITEENPMPGMREAKAALQRMLSAEKVKETPIDLMVIFADNYGNTSFKLDGVTYASSLTNLKAYYKALPKKFSGLIDQAAAGSALQRNLK